MKDLSLARRRQLHRYNISPEQYYAMLERQNNHCAICKNPGRIGRYSGGQRQLNLVGDAGWLVIDHDHKTNRFRGLLCYKCNTTIGSYFDNPDLLRERAAWLISLAEYLEKQPL